MAGIYIHIPFCRQACHYCNFHFSTSLQLKNDFIEALLKEITLQVNYTGGKEIKTIYLGGGTPSLLSIREIEALLNAIQSQYPVIAQPEITIEANPDDINKEKLVAWKQAGINRLSIGIQSFFDEDLQWMNRVHTAAEAQECLNLIQESGFTNFSIDLIYGGPTLTDEHWHENIKKAIALGAPHLSCYALTVEPKTALEKMIALHKKEAVDADKQARHFTQLMQSLEQAGYEHYEISNFALPGFRSRHNSSYWQQESYLGLGPSAHSYNGNSRQWNIANNALYIQSLKNGILNFDEELLTPIQKLNEYIMTSLRTAEGIDLNYINTSWGEAYVNQLVKTAEKNKYRQYIKTIENHIQLTREGKLFADGIAADLFF